MRTSALAIEGEGLKVQEFGAPRAAADFSCATAIRDSNSSNSMSAQVGRVSLIDGYDEAAACRRQSEKTLSLRCPVQG